MFNNFRLIVTLFIFCSFLQGKKAAPAIVCNVQGNTATFINTNDVLCFIDDQINAVQSANSQRSYPGLSNEKEIADLLTKQKYIEVLKYVWNEKNQDKKIAWLKKTAEDGHIICIFELSREYALKGDMAESYFWLLLGMARTSQDVLCCTDRSLEDCPIFLLQCYCPFWHTVVRKDSSFFEKATLNMEKFNQLHKRTLLRLVEYLKNCKKFPSPAWLAPHGLGSFFSPTKGLGVLHPEKTFAAKRKETIDTFELEIKTLQEQKLVKISSPAAKKD